MNIILEFRNMTQFRILVHFAFLALLIHSSSGFSVQIFKDVKFRGLIYDHNSVSGEDCHNVKSYAQGRAGSLKTDTCLMVYEGANCEGNSLRLSRDMKEELENLGRNVFSFRACNEQIGGRKIHVSMYNADKEMVADYTDLCTCQDLPSQVTTNLASLDNHGNCVTVYSSPTCGDKASNISAGKNPSSDELANLGWYIRSISGCGKLRACAKLSASIFKIVILEDSTRSLDDSGSQEIDLATKTTFFNNGSATVFQEYEARSKIRESTTIEMSKSITSMESHTVENGTTKSWGVSVSIPKLFNAAVGVARGVEKGYTTEKTETETETNTFTNEEENEFNVKQVIEVPPCAQYEVSATVEMTENLPLLYELHSKVTGESGGRKLTGEEVATLVDDMTFVETLDEYTAVFKSVHSAVASVGVEATISGEGKPIPGCIKGV